MVVLAFKGSELGMVAQVYHSVTQGVETGATTSNQDFEARLHNLARTRLKHTHTHKHTRTKQKAKDIAGQRKDKDSNSPS